MFEQIHNLLIRNNCWLFSLLVDVLYFVRGRMPQFGNRVIGQIDYSSIKRNLSVAVTNICNAKCVFCAYPITTMKRGVMKLDTFEKGINEWRSIGGDRVDLTPTVGDPLIDVGIVEKVKMAKSIGLKVSFTTNAILLADTAEKILLAGLDELFISLPSFDRTIYAKVYGVDRAEEVMAGVEKILKLNKSMNEPCSIRLRFRNAERPSKILMSFDFRNIVEPYLSDRVTVNFTSGYDNWGGMIKSENMVGTMILKKPIKSNAPCNGLFGLTMLHDGKLRACACRFVDTDNDDLIVGHINNGIKPAQENAEKIADGFIKGERPVTCRECTLYNPIC